MMDGRIMNAIRAVTCVGFLLIAGTQFPANAASMLEPGDYGKWLQDSYECPEYNDAKVSGQFQAWWIDDCPDLDENLCQAILHGFYEYFEADTDWACASDCLDLAGAIDYYANALGCDAECHCQHTVIED